MLQLGAGVAPSGRSTISGQKFFDLSEEGGIPFYGRNNGLTNLLQVDTASGSASAVINRFGGLTLQHVTGQSSYIVPQGQASGPAGENYALTVKCGPSNPGSSALYARSAGTAATNKALRADCGANEQFYVVNAQTRVNNLLSLGAALALASYTVATLPSAAVAGQVAYASNGRVGVELAGAGTGCPVFSKGGQWLKFDTNGQVQA